MYRSPPPVSDRAKGGAAIIVKKSIQHSQISLQTTLQAIAVSVILHKRITICSLYLPPDLHFELLDLQDLINQLPTPYMILGDCNAHNPLWGGDVLDSKGRIIEDLIDSTNSVLYNDGSMTFHNIHRNSYSAIDLSIASPGIFIDYNWLIDDDLNGSDHFPIHLKNITNSPTQCNPKWKVQEADWVKFREEIIIDKEFESFNSHLDAYKYLSDKILKSAETSIPKTIGRPRRPTVPWWNKTCGILRRVTRKCYRKYKTSGSQLTKIIYQRALAKQRKYFKKAKKESWLYYINGINSKTPSRYVWQKIRKLSGKYSPTPLPTLNVNDKLITDPSEVSAKLGEHFSKVSSADNYSPHFRNIRDTQVTLNFGRDNSEPYNRKFTLKELTVALSSTEASAPGEDNILNEMLKHLPEEAKKFFLKIINKIWETGVLPKTWKVSIIIPAKKPNKDAHQATSYRPIALTSCVCKLMEKMINTRLVWHLENKELLSPFQYGFRKNRCTLDPLLRLSNQVQQGFVNQCQTIGVFFDLEKAYDTTWRHGILMKLHKMGIQGNMINFINSFLSERLSKVRVGNTYSNPFLQEEGVPQGSVLSVTCFAIAINDILDVISPPVKGSLFVDDFALYCTGYDAKSVCHYMQKSIDKVSKWADDNGFRFSASKTVAIRFTRRRNLEEIPFLTLNGSILPYEKEVKFLGMIFDEKLNWNKHIDNLKIKVKESMNILKVVSGYNWGADKKSLLRLYDSMCRSKLDYGCQIYSSACATKLRELDVVHNMGLRICTGAFRTSPVESLYVDSNELPLDLRREELGLRYMTRLKSSPKNPTFKIFSECNPHKFGSRSSKPFQIRLLQDLEDSSIQTQKIQPVDHLSVPPWLVPEVKLCEKVVSRTGKSNEEIKAQFLDHNDKHLKHEQLFTDGSKSKEGVGCAVVHNGTSYVAKLPDSASVFSAELTAIVQALELINQSKKREFVIYSDSWSAIESLRKFNSFHPLIQKAQEWLFRFSCRKKSVCFCWVPAHVGIQGNETADKEAKSACSLSNYQIKKVPHSDMRRTIKSYILQKWQERWSSPLLTNNKKYKEIRDSIEIWHSAFNSSRKTEIVLTRLRIGHTRLTHQFILEGGDPPVCDDCAITLSVKHILVECPKFSCQRRKYNFDGRSICEILGDEADVEALVSFLREILIFNEI